MNKRMIVALLAFTSTAAFAGDHGAPWSYSGATGAEHWGQLSPAYAACSAGSNQSPVNIVDAIHGQLKPLGMHYRAGGQQVLNNGHTVQVNFEPGSRLDVDGHAFALKQYHFHAPSENHINGQSFPLEVHLVHADADGHLAVVAVMFKEGKANPALARVWKQMPEHAGDKAQLAKAVSAAALLPASHD